MRRKDKEITNQEELKEIIKEAEVCRLGISVDNKPYIVPLNYGYEDDYLYFHSARSGKKMDMLKINPEVCFEIEGEASLVLGDIAGNCTSRYRSIIGTGQIEFLEEMDEKKSALNIIMKQYTDKGDHEINEKLIKVVSIYRMKIIEMTGKKSGY